MYIHRRLDLTVNFERPLLFAFKTQQNKKMFFYYMKEGDSRSAIHLRYSAYGGEVSSLVSFGNNAGLPQYR